MKCPKCHYLSFDPEPRCKNCGYDLEVADADLAFRTAEDADQSMADLPLRDEAAGDDAPITLELVRSATLAHPDDADDLLAQPPARKRPRIASREPALVGGPRRARNVAAPPAAPAAPAREPLSPIALSPSLRREPAPAARVPEPVTPIVPAEPAAPAVPTALTAPGAPPASDQAPAARVLDPLIPAAPPPPPAPVSAPLRMTFEPVAPAERPRPVERSLPETPVAPPAPPVAAPAPAARVAAPKVAPPTTDLPLFVKETKGREADLIVESPAEVFMRQSGGRPPLVVRRPADTQRPPAPPAYVTRQERRVGPLDHDLLEDLRRVEREEAAAERAAELAARAAQAAARVSSGAHPALPGASGAYLNDAADSSAVAPSQRLTAAALDGFLLGGIGTFVLWATLRVTGVSASAFGFDAILPLSIFLAGVGVSYLLMFTLAGGQTVGKMLAGIRVVPEDDPTERVSFRQAAARALLAPISIAVLGLGWWPALFGRVALHDRLVHTRVVRA